jgi:hypothetical protein
MKLSQNYKPGYQISYPGKKYIPGYKVSNPGTKFYTQVWKLFTLTYICSIGRLASALLSLREMNDLGQEVNKCSAIFSSIRIVV